MNFKNFHIWIFWCKYLGQVSGKIMKVAKAIFSLFLPKYSPYLPLPILAQWVLDGFAKTPPSKEMTWSSHSSLACLCPTSGPWGNFTVNLSTSFRICLLFSNLAATTLVQSAIVSHSLFCNSCLSVSQNPLWLDPTLSPQSSYSGSFRKYQYDHITLLLKSFTGLPFS